MTRCVISMLCALSVLGCSTVEKQIYYSPLGDAAHITGPRRTGCGSHNFGGLPDQFNSSVRDVDVTIEAYQHYQPYLWGPLFITVVPIFPLTWYAQLVADDDISIQIQSRRPDLDWLIGLEFVLEITEGDNESTTVAPTAILMRRGAVRIVFPAQSLHTYQFNFVVSEHGTGKRLLSVPFKRTWRWSWSSWSINC